MVEQWVEGGGLTVGQWVEGGGDLKLSDGWRWDDVIKQGSQSEVAIETFSIVITTLVPSLKVSNVTGESR